MQQQYDRHYRQKLERKGRFAETLAAFVLYCKGYRIEARRWKTRAGEIDLIASKAGVLIFVEVKARKTHSAAVEAVTFQNRRRIEQAANIYVARKHLTPVPPFRFDIFTVAGSAWQHRRNAWRSGD